MLRARSSRNESHTSRHGPWRKTTPEGHDDIYRLDGLWDLILCHDELLTALKIEEALVVGH
jgi:hypothetical protein